MKYRCLKNDVTFRQYTNAVGGAYDESTEQTRVTIREYALLEEKTIDDLITEAEIVLIGTVSAVSPSRWDTADGNVSPNLTLEEIYEADLITLHFQEWDAD